MSDHPYLIRYAVELGRFTKADGGKDGLTDAVLIASIVYGDDGSSSTMFMSRDGRTGQPLQPAQLVGQVWGQMADVIATDPDTPPAFRKIASDALEAIRGVMTDSRVLAEPAQPIALTTCPECGAPARAIAGDEFHQVGYRHVDVRFEPAPMDGKVLAELIRVFEACADCQGDEVCPTHLLAFTIAFRSDLIEAIRKHRDAKGHDRCHLNDRELYAAAGLEPADFSLPPLNEFIAACIRYHEGQCR
jgi:hypothetical protein